MKQIWLAYFPAVALVLFGTVLAFIDPDGFIRFIGWIILVAGGVLGGRTSKEAK